MAHVTVPEEFITFQRDRLPVCTVAPAGAGTVDLSICLVNWNTSDLLKACLGSIYAHSGDLAIEVFVIDNASSDDSTDMVKREFPEVILVENTENLGFAQANNQGIAQSTGRYVLLLNPDTLILPGALQRMVR
ncbi:MAG TPA: glycosyltransferase, partial [bacterium]|nr:glycosyltransferase [bacterium]